MDAMAGTGFSVGREPEPGLLEWPRAVPAPATATPAPTEGPATAIPAPNGGPATSTPATGPTIQITIPEKIELKHPKLGSMLDDLIARVEAGEISAEDAAQEAPVQDGDSVAVTIDLSGNVAGVLGFLEGNGGSRVSVGEDYIEAFVPVLLLGKTVEQPGVLRVRVIVPGGIVPRRLTDYRQGPPRYTVHRPGTRPGTKARA